MPFVFAGFAFLIGAGVVALVLQHKDNAAPGAGPRLGATPREPDPPSAPTTNYQTTSSAEGPSSSLVDERAAELPDRWASSGSATSTPIGVRIPEDPFPNTSTAPGGNVAHGYAVDDLTPAPPIILWEKDDIEEPADLAFAPAAYAGGRVAGLLK
jgi:hypothetical protein